MPRMGRLLPSQDSLREEGQVGRRGAPGPMGASGSGRRRAKGLSCLPPAAHGPSLDVCAHRRDAQRQSDPQPGETTSPRVIRQATPDLTSSSCLLVFLHIPMCVIAEHTREDTSKSNRDKT